jgi:uncharacterized membrane protein YgcG
MQEGVFIYARPIGATESRCSPPATNPSTTSIHHGYARHHFPKYVLVDLNADPIFWSQTAAFKPSHTRTRAHDLATNVLQKLPYSYEAYRRASALVTALLQQLNPLPAPYGSCPAPENDPLPSLHSEDTLAEAAVAVDASAPSSTPSADSEQPNRLKSGNMDIDFGDTFGTQTRGKKAAKKAAQKAQQAKWFESDNEGDGGATGEGGDDGLGGGGDGSAGAGGGGDDNGGNGGEDDGDDWAFGGGKKNKKKNKKKQEEEERQKEEEEQKKKDEEAANAMGSLNWADDANDAAAGDDWATGFTSKKDKKKKKKVRILIASVWNLLTLIRAMMFRQQRRIHQDSKISV